MTAAKTRLIVLSIAACVLTAAAAPASQLSQVIQKGNHIIALNRLELTTEQLAAVQPLSQELVGAVKARDTARKTLLAASATDLAAARWKLAGGDPLPDDLAARMDALDSKLTEADDTLYKAAVEILDEIKEELRPAQNAAIDWTPPRGGSSSAAEALVERAEQERAHQAMVMMAERFLHSIRYYPIEQYIVQAQRLVDDFLRPLIDPRSPDYEPARDYMFRLVEQVRVLKEDEWVARGPEFAERMIVDLGLEQPSTPQTDRIYDWSDMYAVFSDLAAPELLGAMRAARMAPVGPQR